MRLTQLLLFALLSSIELWLGIVPAFTNLDTDFPSYYTASRLVVDGRDMSRLYDDDWFQAQMNSYGIDQPGKFTPFPPLTALTFVPLAGFSPLHALQIWTVVNLVFLIFCIFLLSKITGKDWLWCSLLYLASGLALINNFRFGQMYLLLSLLVCLGYLLWQRSQQKASGITLGVGAALKYFPVAFLPLFIARREWKLLIAFASSIAILYALAAAVMGTEVFGEFFSKTFASHLGGHLGGNGQDPFSSAYQSWDSLLRRLLVYDPTWNSSPIVDSTPGFYICKSAIILTIIGAAIAGFRKLEKTPGAQQSQFVLITVAALLVLPDSATYHFLLLALPVGILLGTSKWRWEQKLVLGLFVILGFIPYRFFRPFDGKGLLTLLAYPRLGLMIAIFLTILSYVWHREKPQGSSAP